MISAKEIKNLTDRYGTLKGARGTWESHWQEIAELIYTRRADFNTLQSPGTKRMSKVFDSSPIHTNELLASGLHGMMTNPASKWFSMGLPEGTLLKSKAVDIWLHEISTIMLREINRPKAGFATAMHEFYMDFGAINTALLFVGTPTSLEGLSFETRSVAEVVIEENADGHVDTFYRQWEWTIAQALQRWAKASFSAATQRLIEKNEVNMKIKILHVIKPRRSTDPKKSSRDQKPFASIYIEADQQHVIQETGFDEQAMMAARFSKTSASEIYGRGPGVTTLPDVRMLNEMMRTTIKSAQKAVDPPLFVEDDSIVGPLRSVPSGINYFKRGRTPPSILNVSGDVRLGDELMEGIRNRIRSAFFVDQLQLNVGPQMTATEVNQRTEEKLRLMSPILGRLQTELLDPMLDRVFGILTRQGKLPPAPPELLNLDITPIYESPLARAQRQLEANGLIRTIEVLGPLIDRDPTVLDNFDADFAANYIGVELFGINPQIIRSPEARKQIRDQRNQDEQERAALEKDQMVADVRQTNAQAGGA